jgi:hypothetical protein
MIQHQSGPKMQKSNAAKKNGEHGEGVNPCILLPPNHGQDARNRVIEVTNATGELERARLDFIVRVGST